MSIKTLSNFHIQINVNKISGSFKFGDILQLKDLKSGESCNFVCIGINTFEGVLVAKPLGEDFLIPKLGMQVNSEIINMTSMKNDRCYVSGIKSKKIECSEDEGLYLNIDSPTDVPENLLVNRYSLISKIGVIDNWNKSFMSGSVFSNVKLDYSFLSINGQCKIPDTYYGNFLNAVRAIKISNSYCLIHKSSIDYYMSNNLQFLSNSNVLINRKIKAVSLVYDLINKQEVNSSNPELSAKLNKLYDFYICEFDYISDDAGVASVKFMEDIDSLKLDSDTSHFLYINNHFDCGLIRPEWNAVTGGFYQIKNTNYYDNSTIEGSYSSDYIVYFTPSDDHGMLYGEYNEELYIVGLCDYVDIKNFTGSIKYENNYFPDGKNSSGNYAQSLTDSGNFCSIEKIKYKFDKDILYYLKSVVNYLSDNNESISTINASVSFSKINAEARNPFIGVFHSYFVGETLPGIIDNRYSRSSAANSYINGSAFLDRNIKPIMQYVNQSGDIGRSLGYSFRPNYAYMMKQNKVFSIPFNGIVNAYIVKENLQTKIQVTSDKYGPGFKVDLSINRTQYNHIEQIGALQSYNDILCDEAYSLLYKNDRLHYLRGNGECSNVCRHDDAAVVYYLASSFLSFMSNNLYSQRVVNLYNIVIDGSYDSFMNPFYLTYLISNNGCKALSFKDSDNNDIIVVPEDVHIFNYEIKRLINSIKNFSNRPNSVVYKDFLYLLEKSAKDNNIKNREDYKKIMIDAALFVSQFGIYVHGMGDLGVDIFALLRNKNGKIDLSNLLGINNPALNNINVQNTSSEKSYSIYSHSLSNEGVKNIWAGYVSAHGSGELLYSGDSIDESSSSYIYNFIDICIQRWLNNISSISSYIDGYFVPSFDDSSYVLDEEIKARNYVMIDALNIMIKDNGYKTYAGLSFSPISHGPLRSKDSVYVYSNYIKNNERMINNEIKPSLSAGCSVFLQREDVDTFIDNQFLILDDFSINPSVAKYKKVRNALCFLSCVYNSDTPPVLKIFTQYESNSIDFNGIRLNSNTYGAYKSNLRMKVEDYVNDVMPLGEDIADADVSLDRSVIRSRIYHYAQDSISNQLDELLRYINDSYNSLYSIPYAIKENVYVSDSYYSSEIHGLFIGHNSFSNASLNVGYFVKEMYFNNNYIHSPSGVGSWNLIKRISKDFYKNKILHSESLFDNNYINNVSIFSSGEWPYYGLNNKTYNNFTLTGGEGDDSNVNGVTMRWPKYSQIKG